MTIDFPQRIVNDARPGALLKSPLPLRPTSPRRSTLIRDPDYLAMVRQCPCLKCGLDGFSQAAHVRMNGRCHGQAIGAKPGDARALPLCADCHLYDADAQHKVGELAFWNDLGINPLIVCDRLYAKRGDVPAMRAVIYCAIAERESLAQDDGIKSVTRRGTP